MKRLIPEKCFLTREGITSLRQTLESLKQERQELGERLKTIRTQEGIRTETDRLDWAERLRECQLLEDEIQKLEKILHNAKVMKKPRVLRRVVLGSSVHLVGKGVKFCYRIVNPLEANPLEGKISDQSPLGKALLGKGLRERISWQFGQRTPIQLELVKIE